jgi:septum formation protein
MTRILLASNSARRRQLITLTGWEVTYTSADIDESRQPDEPARQYVARLAHEKASRALQTTHEEVILAADTIVVDHETIYGKPSDNEEARKILLSLRGHIHQVMTAITLVDRENDIRITNLCESSVPMRQYTATELDTYILSGDPMDKAGAYAIQNREFHPVEAFNGCFASVMGIPLCHLERSALKLGLSVKEGLANRCQATLGYHCAIYKDVLRGDIIG